MFRASVCSLALALALGLLTAKSTLAAPASAGEKLEGIKLAADPNYPSGFRRDLIAAIMAKDTGMHFVVIDGLGSFRHIIAELISGGIDIYFGLAKTAELERLVTFLDETPLYRVDYQLAARSDDPADLKNLDQLQTLEGGAIVLSMQGRQYTDILKKMPRVNVDDGALSAEANLRKLVDLRGRFFFAGSQLLKYSIAKENLTDRIRILPAIFDSKLFYVAASKSLDPQIVQQLKVDLMSLEKGGELARLRIKNNLTDVAARPAAK